MFLISNRSTVATFNNCIQLDPLNHNNRKEILSIPYHYRILTGNITQSLRSILSHMAKKYTFLNEGNLTALVEWSAAPPLLGGSSPALVDPTPCLN